MNNELTHNNNKCPVCNFTDISAFFEILQLPVYCGMLFQTRAEAINTARGNTKLGFCKNCGHIFNSAFNPDFIEHTQEYDNSLHFSSRFQEYAKSLATRLIDRYDLRNKDIIEIGCGKGDFLMLLCKLGKNRGVGFDTTFVKNRIKNVNKDQITFINDFYTEHYASYKADLICCRHVLEHIQYPRDFLINLRNIIGNKRSPSIFFEVPNVTFALRDLSIWDIFYEHCAYYSISSLEYLFRSCKFGVSYPKEEYEGQFISIETYPVEGISCSKYDFTNEIKKISHYVALFSNKYQKIIEAWQQEIEKLILGRKKIVVWGGGAKGVTFLNTVKAQDQIDYVVDINPYKHGKYIPGTGQKIIPPEYLKEYKPDVIIIMNHNYYNEIQQFTNNMNLTVKLMSINDTSI